MAELRINLAIVQRSGELIEEPSEAVFKDGELGLGGGDLIKHLIKGQGFGGCGSGHG